MQVNMAEYDEFLLDFPGQFQCASRAEFEDELVARDIRVTHSLDFEDPVIVYMEGHKYVAWYDTELRYGYMPEY
jgi:hypothetical protein